ncbi:hypothetical protein [Streptomyces sp. 891-h]|uniref:hypothetical protein n=1 Tax=Streptomyces sp. 891-h TaxID=2720714 RepID=UPI001FA9AD14|nr:hypothetical protein [Streptomyces sp. 891-h]UNZ21173.1 hypothetical protein HC362_32950 [Streptomyces sp. 891-h]
MADNLFLSIDFGTNNGPGTDDGKTRPWNGGTPFYTSTSIWVDPGYHEAQVGRTTTVKVRVSNRGTQTVPGVVVQAWLFEPQIGVWTPGTGMPFISSGSTDIAPGSGTLSSSDPHVVTCRADPDWVPTEEQLNRTNAHVCVIANCYSDEVSGEGGPAPADVKLEPALNPRQGQRNLALVKVQQAAASQPHTVPHWTSPPPADPGPHGPYLRELLMTSQQVMVSNVIGISELLALANLPEVKVPEGGLAKGELLLRTSYGTKPIRPHLAPMRFGLKAEGIPELGQRFRLDPEERERVPSQLEFQFGEGADVGSLQVFDVTLHTEKEVVGAGLRVIALVTE